MNLSQIKKAYFIGIGGIGISALAKVYSANSWQIEGSDLQDSEIIKNFQKQGFKVWVGPHRASHIKKNIDLVIYSPAVPKDNPELKQAKKIKIRTLSYPQALGELTKEYWTIAVSGTHGKSTTTAMLACILIKAGLDPTVVIGTKLKELGNSNARIGQSKYLLIEADEWRASFLNYWPKMIVLTNIEAEHLDYYKDMKIILRTFKEYINHLSKKEGVLVANQDDQNIQKILPADKNYLYSWRQKETNKIKKILKVPGRHNVYNALAALAAARCLAVKDKIIFKALSEFSGTWRRFEIIKQAPYVLINDYAHHPTEIKATLQAAREKFPKRRIICVFQPHQRQRTELLFRDFVRVLAEVDRKGDRIILAKIFEVAGREKKKKKISSYDLVREIKKLGRNIVYLEKFSQIIRALKREIKPEDVVLIMGAGDVWQLSTALTLKVGRKVI